MILFYVCCIVLALIVGVFATLEIINLARERELSGSGIAFYIILNIIIYYVLFYSSFQLFKTMI